MNMNWWVNLKLITKVKLCDLKIRFEHRNIYICAITLFDQLASKIQDNAKFLSKFKYLSVNNEDMEL